MAVVGFTGTRKGLTSEQKKTLDQVMREEVGDDGEVHHGDAVGADAYCHVLALKHKYRIVIHPPEEVRYRAYCSLATEVVLPCSYLIRNRHIVQETSLLIACPDGPYRLRSGTWYTVKYARSLSKPVILIHPDGRIEEYD